MTLTLPKTMIAGTAENVNDVQANDAYLAAAVDLTNTAAGVSSAAGWRGKSIIATSESRASATFATLTTPDQVTGIVLPTDGLIRVLYQATWQSSVGVAGQAAIFVGATQLKVALGGQANPVVQSAVTSGNTATDAILASTAAGLEGSVSATAYLGDVTTGQLVGGGIGATADSGYGACYIFAAAGTYTISVQFKASSGTVTAKNRKLWVAAEGF